MLLKELLDGYLAVRRREGRDVTGRLEVLLSGWREVLRAQHRTQERVVDDLLPGYQEALLRVQQAQIRTADDFNLLDLLDFTGDELRHSRILAWLVDGRETHAQGDLGFRLFVEELGLDPGYTGRRHAVKREVSGEKSRIDIEISARREFLIHIENKIWSKEGENQLGRESEDLRRRAVDLVVATEHVHAYYLTPSGRIPACPGLFKPLRWRTIARLFEQFSERSQAESVKWFTRHYAEALTALVIEPTEEEEA